MTTFEFSRFKALFVREFHTNFKSILKVLLIIILTIFIINLFSAVFSNSDSNEHQIIINFGLILLIGGFIYSSLAFSEFMKITTRAEYLSLPGSSLEKITVKWLYTNLFVIIAVTGIFLILGSLFMPIIDNFQMNEYSNEILTSKSYWNLVGVYFIVHSVFFFGSIAFNRGAIIKTLLYLIAITAIVAIICGVWFRIVYAEYFDSLWHMTPPEGTSGFGNKYSSPDEMPQVKFIIFAFKYILAPVLWVASIFKLSEKEV